MEEKENKRKSIIITAIVQVVVLLVLYLAVAWKEPFPPIPEYGIELSIGFDQNTVTSTARPVEEVTEESDEAETVEEQQVEEDISEPESTEEPAQPAESNIQEASQPAATVDVHSPDVEQEETVEENTTQVESDQTEQQEEKVVVEEQVEPVKEETGTPAQSEPTEEPQIDERALYTNPASGQGESQGASLQMTGWRLASIPDPNDDSQESGQIIFEIKVDSDGYIVSIRTLTSTVTPAVERAYRRAVEQLILEKTDDYQPARISTGKITFILKAR